MPAKSSLRDENKKLTDFFTQKPSASVPPLATSSSPAAPTTTSVTRKRPTTRAVIDHESSKNPSTFQQTRSTSTTTTRKRPRSPDMNDTSPPNVRSSRRHMKTFQSASYAKRPTAVVHVTSPFHARNAPLTSPSDSSKQVVCSSQSDEAELVLPIPESRDVRKVVEDVHTWRRKTSEFSRSSPHARDDAMEVDMPSSSPVLDSPETSVRSISPHRDTHIRSAPTPSNNAACFSSPPDSPELLPLPPTPQPIDPETKTARLIADIKARAFAANQFSDDEQPLAFRELDDSDDGELIDDLPLISNANERDSLYPAPRATSGIFSSPLSSVPSTFGDTAIGCRTRKSLRTSRISARPRKLAPAFHLPTTIAESSISVGEKKSGSFPPNRKKQQTTNPLYALLREKELQDKRGTSRTAVRLAEEAVKNSSRDTSISSDDEFDTRGQSRLTDEQAAWQAVYESRKSTSPVGLADADDIMIGDRESKLLGAVAGESINRILAGDKDGKGKEGAQSTNQKITSGIALWIQSSHEDMEVDSVSTPPLSGHSILSCLEDFLGSGDDSSVDLILRAGALAAVPRDILLSNMSRLLDMALFMSSQISDAVCIALRDLWELKLYKGQIHLTAFLFILVRLGASPSTLERLGLIVERAPIHHVGSRMEALKRLLAIIRTAGFTGAFSSEDVANVVLILVVMGLDPSTSSELHTQLNITIDVICNYGSTDYLSHDIHEKVLCFSRQLIPINKARSVSFFASGSGRTRCIARRLAYCLLVSSPTTQSGQTLPLEPLILLLSPDAGSHEVFDVTSELTNYEELGHYVDILSVALIDIASYIEEERALMKSANSASVQGSPTRSKKSPVPPLELLRRVLEVLQSKIVDTRAAHLDRSRTKAAIQRLTMRICYDRMALMGVRHPRRRASTLKAYFSPNRQ